MKYWTRAPATEFRNNTCHDLLSTVYTCTVYASMLHLRTVALKACYMYMYLGDRLVVSLQIPWTLVICYFVPGVRQQFCSVLMEVLKSPLALIPPPRVCKVYINREGTSASSLINFNYNCKNMVNRLEIIHLGEVWLLYICTRYSW